MFKLLGFAIALSAYANTADVKDPDHDALMILARNCAGCHQAADHPGALFLNRERLSERDTVALIRKLVDHSQMPPAHKNFKKTADGQKLLRWLAKKEKSLAPK